MENCTNWFYLCLAILGVFLFLYIMLLDYNLKAKKQQIELSKRTEELEKKNGKEMRRIEEVEQKNEQLNKKVEQLEKQLNHEK